MKGYGGMANTQLDYHCFVQMNISACCSTAMLKLERDPDKGCQIHRHDVGSCPAETGHFGSDQLAKVWCWTTENSCPVDLMSLFYVLKYYRIVLHSVLFFKVDTWVFCVMPNIELAYQNLYLCVWFSEVQRIKLLTPWIWTHSHRDSKQPCQSFNPR